MQALTPRGKGREAAAQWQHLPKVPRPLLPPHSPLPPNHCSTSTSPPPWSASKHTKVLNWEDNQSTLLERMLAVFINILFIQEHLVAERWVEGGRMIFAVLQVYSSTGGFFGPPHIYPWGVCRGDRQSYTHCIWIEYLCDIFYYSIKFTFWVSVLLLLSTNYGPRWKWS